MGQAVVEELTYQKYDNVFPDIKMEMIKLKPGQPNFSFCCPNFPFYAITG